MTKANNLATNQKRDGETYIAVGIFVVAVGLPVLAGTYWAAMKSPHAAIVNGICGGVLVAIGVTAIVYGRLLLRRSRRQA